jgi:hypothetical protein
MYDNHNLYGVIFSTLIDVISLPTCLYRQFYFLIFLFSYRCEILLLQIQYLEILSEAVYPLF